MRGSFHRKALVALARALLCAALVGIPCSSDAAASQQRESPGQERPAFVGEVHLSTVAVTVTDGDRIPIPNLTKDDFELYEDGQRQQIAFLLTPERAPLELAVVIDASGSVERRVPEIRQLLADFLAALDPRDCVLMLPFGGGSVGPGYWNLDVEHFAFNLGFGGHTRLYDAINAGLRGLDGDAGNPASLARGGDCGGAPRGRDRRQGIVLITDGIDTLSYASYGETLVNLWEARIPMIVLGIPTGRAPRTWSLESQMRASWYQQARWPGREELTELAKVSGGALVRANDGREARAFEEILARLRSMYLIAYYLSDPPVATMATWRQIEVRVRNEKASVVAPDGVYASASRPGDAAQWGEEGRSFFDGGDYQRALEYTERATAARWETPSAHYLRAIAARRMGQLEVAEDAARWAVFLDPTDTSSRALLRDIGLHVGEGPDPSATLPLGTLWIEPASHPSLPRQQVGAHVARMVAGHVDSTAEVKIIRRPRAAGVGHGLTVRVDEIDDDGRIEGEITLVDEELREVDSADFELTAPEASISARDAPPSATRELDEAIDRLLERVRARIGSGIDELS